MNYRAALVAAFALFACADPPPRQQPTLVGFGWLEGCWLSRDGAVERWEPANGAFMTGNNLYPQSDGSQISQALRIEVLANDTVFTARTADGAEATYALTSRGDAEAVFENAGNIGPKRVSYRRNGDALIATLSETLDPDTGGYVTRYQPCANDTIAP